MTHCPYCGQPTSPPIPAEYAPGPRTVATAGLEPGTFRFIPLVDGKVGWVNATGPGFEATLKEQARRYQDD